MEGKGKGRSEDTPGLPLQNTSHLVTNLLKKLFPTVEVVEQRHRALNLRLEKRAVSNALIF